MQFNLFWLIFYFFLNLRLFISHANWTLLFLFLFYYTFFFLWCDFWWLTHDLFATFSNHFNILIHGYLLIVTII